MMLQEMCCAVDKVFLCSDEKIFTVEPQVKVQNDGILEASRARIEPLLRTVIRRRKSERVTVSFVVTSDGSKPTLVFIYKDVKVSTQVSLKTLEKHVLLWITESS